MKKLRFIALGFALLLTIPLGARAQATPGQPKMNVAILIYDGVEIIDYTGPYEVLGSWGKRKVYTVAKTSAPVTTNMGMLVMPNYNFENQPKPDILVIPGGRVSSFTAVVDDPATIKWVRDSGREAKYILSVCNGAFIMAKAGLLDGLGATTIAGLIDDLKKAAPKSRVVPDQRYVDNGKIIVTAGLSSGIDGSLHLVSRLDGEGWAQAIALSLEYNWEPESKFVRLMLADKKLPRSIYEPLGESPVPLKFISRPEMSDSVWSIASPRSPAEMLRLIDEKWFGQPSWKLAGSKPVEPSGGASAWKFIDQTGRSWNASVSVQPAAEKDRLLVSFSINRAESSAQAQI